MAGARRREIQRRFNAPPAEDPLRILLATDAAREGLNFQAHCTDLFHFDLPWNPGRIEQRNGRIDRKLQPAARSALPVLQAAPAPGGSRARRPRAEDRNDPARTRQPLEGDRGRHRTTAPGQGSATGRSGQLALWIEKADSSTPPAAGSAKRNSTPRGADRTLSKRRTTSAGTLLARSRQWIGFEEEAFREALSCSLEILGADPLKRRTTDQDGAEPIWEFPSLAQPEHGWEATLDALRVPRKRREQQLTDWREQAPSAPGRLPGRRDV